MCFATPGKVTKIKGKIATIEMPEPQRSRSATLQGKHAHTVDISLLKGVKIGDYLLCHDKMAINKIPKSEAKQILKIKKEN